MEGFFEMMKIVDQIDNYDWGRWEYGNNKRREIKLQQEFQLTQLKFREESNQSKLAF